MKVMVVGKEHAGGTSKKTGKPFSATLVHVSYKKMHCDGAAVETIWLDDGLYPLEVVQVGKPYDLDRDSRGYVVGFDPAH